MCINYTSSSLQQRDSRSRMRQSHTFAARFNTSALDSFTERSKRWQETLQLVLYLDYYYTSIYLISCKNSFGGEHIISDKRFCREGFVDSS